MVHYTFPVLHRPTSSALQAKQLELERQQHSDSLRKQLEKRAERDDLVGRKCRSLLLDQPHINPSSRQYPPRQQRCPSPTSEPKGPGPTHEGRQPRA